MKIVIDSREASKAYKIVDALKMEGYTVIKENLPVGDYHIIGLDKGYIVERKTTTDLVHTLKGGRLWNQVRMMTYVQNAEPLLLLESSLAKVRRFTKFSPESVIGLELSIELDWKVPILFTSNIRETVKALILLSRRATKGRKVSYYPIRYVPKILTPNERARALVEGLSLVSATRSVALLEYFKKPVNVFNAKYEELIKVAGIGHTIASKIVEDVNIEYKKEGKV